MSTKKPQKKNDARQKDWRTGHFASPKEGHLLNFPSTLGIAKFFVLKTHPSGTEGIECIDGVLEMSCWWLMPGGYYVIESQRLFSAADQWAVA